MSDSRLRAKQDGSLYAAANERSPDDGPGTLGTRVTAEDIETGSDGVIEIKDNYVVITDGECQITSEQRYAGGTTVLTIRRGPALAKWKAENDG